MIFQRTHFLYSCLCDKDINSIKEHINNIFKVKELDKDSVIQDFQIPALNDNYHNKLGNCKFCKFRENSHLSNNKTIR